MFSYYMQSDITDLKANCDKLKVYTINIKATTKNFS